VGGEGPGFFWADELFVSSTDSPAARGEPTGRAHFAFQAESAEMVKKAYEAGLSAGGKDGGAPGPRPYHPGYYAAFLIDPDGNNVEAVFHGPAQRSAVSVVIDF
jgi:lactoylglutathione lyase